MKNLFVGTVIGTLSAAALTLSAPAALAATVSYTFTVTPDAGGLGGQSFSGNFSYDDAQVPMPGLFGGDLYGLSSFNFSFTGGPFSLTDLDYASAVIEGGVFTGLEVGAATFAFTPASGPFAASFAYDLGGGTAGFGSIVYTARVAQVPEPGTAWLAAGLLAGLAGLRRRRG